MSGQTLSPKQIGIGMRISVHPHSNDFERIILDALKETHRILQLDEPDTGIEIATGEVSTYVGVKSGDAAPQLAAYAATLIHSAALDSDGQHLTSHLLLSRGCPGETICQLVPGQIPAEKDVHLAKSGVIVAAAWSLYPLADDGSSHMEPIMAAIDEAKASGLTVTSEHYATILRGDLSDVLSVIFDAWSTVGQEVPHVVSHVSISINSPSVHNGAGAA